MERDESRGIAGEPGGKTESIQGEGDYRAAREYRDEVKEVLEHADVERAARDAAPRSSEEARELAEAEAAGRSRAKTGPRRTRATTRSLGRAVRERPVTAVVIAGALGYFLGRRGRHRERGSMTDPET